MIFLKNVLERIPGATAFFDGLSAPNRFRKRFEKLRHNLNKRAGPRIVLGLRSTSWVRGFENMNNRHEIFPLVVVAVHVDQTSMLPKAHADVLRALTRFQHAHNLEKRMRPQKNVLLPPRRAAGAPNAPLLQTMPPPTCMHSWQTQRRTWDC